MPDTLAHPPIATHETWLAARKALLTDERALTQARDAVNARRRRLPMVPVEKTYVFDTPGGENTLLDLFEGRRQLVVYHFMFDPSWENGCPGCTGFVNALGDLSMLAKKDTSFAIIARAPLEKLERYRATKGWRLPLVSSFRTDFNYDFHATLDESVRPLEHNYHDKAELERRGELPRAKGESHAMSVFFRIDDAVYLTYQTFARGTEGIASAVSMLDLTPFGRQEDFEDSPPGWPQGPTYG